MGGNSDRAVVEVGSELDELQKLLHEKLLPFANDILPDDGHQSAENLMKQVTDSITDVKNKIEVSSDFEQKGWTDSEIKAVGRAATGTAEAIVNAMDDLQSDSYLRKSAGLVNIIGAASSFAIVIPPPAGLIVAAVVGSFCILTARILKQVEQNQRDDESPDAMIRRAVEEIKEAVAAAFFKENMADYQATLHGMQTHLGDIDQHYKRDLKDMEERHYDQLCTPTYMDDGEGFLEKLLFFIEKCLKQPNNANESNDAKHGAALIHAYVTIAFIRRQQLTKMMFVFERKNYDYFFESASRRLHERFKKDQQRFQWLQDDPNDLLNHALYAEVVLLPHSKRSLIESYVGKIPGQLCILSAPHYSCATPFQLEMRPGQGNADARLYTVRGRMLSRNKKFIIYLHDNRLTISIFSLGGAGYLRPDENDMYVVAGKRHDWYYDVFHVCDATELGLAFIFGKERAINFSRSRIIYDAPCKLKNKSESALPRLLKKKNVLKISPVKLRQDDVYRYLGERDDFWRGKLPLNGRKLLMMFDQSEVRKRLVMLEETKRRDSLVSQIKDYLVVDDSRH